MQFSLLTTASLLVLLALGTTQSEATITNGDFSSGLTGWSTSGVVWVSSGEARLRNTGGVNLAAMESALGLSSGELQTFSNGLSGNPTNPTVTNGSVMTRTISGASSYISFDWNFWRNDYPPYNDMSFFTISGPGITGTDIILLSDVNSSTAAQATTSGQGYNRGTGWQTFSYALPSTGTYTIGFGVSNSSDTAVASYLYIDDVDSLVIPEPSAGFTAIALLGTGLWFPLRRKR